MISLRFWPSFRVLLEVRNRRAPRPLDRSLLSNAGDAKTIRTIREEIAASSPSYNRRIFSLSIRPGQGAETGNSPRQAGAAVARVSACVQVQPPTRRATMRFLFFSPYGTNRIFMSKPPPQSGHSRVGGKNEIGSDNVWRPLSRGFLSDALHRSCCGFLDVDRGRQFDSAGGGSLVHLDARKPRGRAMRAPCEISVRTSLLTSCDLLTAPIRLAIVSMTRRSPAKSISLQAEIDRLFPAWI